MEGQFLFKKTKIFLNKQLIGIVLLNKEVKIKMMMMMNRIKKFRKILIRNKMLGETIFKTCTDKIGQV